MSEANLQGSQEQPSCEGQLVKDDEVPGKIPVSSDEASQQEFHAHMKMRMLKFWAAARGRDVETQCYGGAKVSGVFQGTDAVQEVLLMEGLCTPLGTYPYAMVRASDVVVMDFKS
jgi:hypothetical protein